VKFYFSQCLDKQEHALGSYVSVIIYLANLCSEVVLI
jgi:hypothetical protein